MKYFAVLLIMLDNQKSQDYRPQHLEYLAERRKEGKIFANGRFPDGTGGMVIYRLETEEEAHRIVQMDPFIINGARKYEIHEWEIVTDAVLPGEG